MAKKKQEEAPKGSPAWMATFSDLMNLLLCFFVLLFSMSSIEVEKFEMVVNSLQSAFSILESGGSQITEGALIGSGISQLPSIANSFGDTLNDTEGREQADGDQIIKGGDEDANNPQENPPGEGQDGQQATENTSDTSSKPTVSEAQEALEQNGLAESEQMAENIEALATEYGLQDIIEVDFNGQFVRITLSGALLFTSGSADLRGEAEPVVKNIANLLNNYQNSQIEIEGHTDNVPIRSQRFDDNEVLSMFRARTVANAIRNNSTLNPANITSSGRGEYDPIADNSTSEGRTRNRRVEIKIFNSYASEIQ